MSDIDAIEARHYQFGSVEDGLPFCACGDEWPCDARQVLDALHAAEDQHARLRKVREAAQALVDSAVLVPMEREDDDDGPAEVWCVHPDPLTDCRVALASTEEPAPTEPEAEP